MRDAGGPRDNLGGEYPCPLYAHRVDLTSGPFGLSAACIAVAAVRCATSTGLRDVGALPKLTVKQTLGRRDCLFAAGSMCGATPSIPAGRPAKWAVPEPPTTWRWDASPRPGSPQATIPPRESMVGIGITGNSRELHDRRDRRRGLHNLMRQGFEMHLRIEAFGCLTTLARRSVSSGEHRPPTDGSRMLEQLRRSCRSGKRGPCRARRSANRRISSLPRAAAPPPSSCGRRLRWR